ncbi:RNA polymerase, sigma subunit, ECF family [Tistlia consotensis]|uniref:RNA polymerase, sigma subunit, ECF family n=1 Tax=Tistlia consotensis USBA 355 TaxID=560819 RepID=A0A1Y6BBM4_9PROT|nr:sigma-70 family RNA polymerase sigma factor [Tistlia consotensis]SME94934.1 RNA polymerase, sigma subunit, ECF family [Tistlia consotensis USBA 355]SNR29626.1 RNA polymerase, sigma subunit, ECF family [Tistlia consotensis]
MTAEPRQAESPAGGAPDSSTRVLAPLLAACAAGDRAAFATLYQASSAKLFGVALRILRRDDWARDVVQDAYLTIWRRAGDYRAERGTPMTWMIAIVRNRALDRLRRDRGERSLDELTEAGLEPDDPQALARVAAAGEGSGTRLVTCLGQLDARARRCILRAYCEGYTHSELAEREAAALGTVKSWIRRGLIQLKSCLESREATP